MPRFRGLARRAASAAVRLTHVSNPVKRTFRQGWLSPWNARVLQPLEMFNGLAFEPERVVAVLIIRPLDRVVRVHAFKLEMLASECRW